MLSRLDIFFLVTRASSCVVLPGLIASQETKVVCYWQDMSNSEKMDQDREQIAELKVRTEVSESLVVQLQQALNQAHTELAEVTKSSADGLQQSSKEILVLKQKLASCIAALDSKDIELSNLQSALGQYYAESEAQV